ncbi:MAG: type II toxin-antitoxin system mRNA interferase toxin, RelE/StbE family [Candidatus Magasanikbacteria bacterium]|nr:type II toxin-antitoxin system mRNA interferase toxin, RelE/StbE family [Candidatus Magasanikbacteria bacterium]
MALLYYQDFESEARNLPKAAQQKLARCLELLANQPFHPLLHTKRLGGELLGVYSFRITRDWRVLFQFLDQQTIQLLAVGHRKEIYR